MGVEERKKEVLNEFKNLSSWEEKYRLIIDWGKKYPKLEKKLLTEENEVGGCLSRVWLIPEIKGDLLYFQCESEGIITRGLISVLTYVYSGSNFEEILEDSVDFMNQMGFDSHFTKNRSNGILSMMKKLKYYAFTYKLLEEKRS